MQRNVNSVVFVLVTTCCIRITVSILRPVVFFSLWIQLITFMRVFKLWSTMGVFSVAMLFQYFHLIFVGVFLLLFSIPFRLCFSSRSCFSSQYYVCRVISFVFVVLCRLISLFPSNFLCVFLVSVVLSGFPSHFWRLCIFLFCSLECT